MPLTQSTLHIDIEDTSAARAESARGYANGHIQSQGHGTDPAQAAAWHRAAQDGDVAQWRGYRLLRYERRGERDYEWRACPTCSEPLSRPVRVVQVEYAVTVHVGQPGAMASTNALASSGPRLCAVDWTADPVAFGHVLRRRREMARLTRVELAARAGVADSTIRNIEMGRHRATRFTIACLLGVKELSLNSAEEAAAPPVVLTTTAGAA